MTQAESLWQMRCIARQPDYRPQVACGSTALLYCCCLCWKPTRRNESDEFGNSEQSVSRFSAFGWRSGFSLSSAKLLVKVSIDIFVCFPLASSAGRSVHTPGSLKTPAATLRRKVVYQLASIQHTSTVRSSSRSCNREFTLVWHADCFSQVSL